MTSSELEWMDAYIDNKLPAAERLRFEAQLAEDARFAREFEEQKELRAVVYNYFKAKQTYAESRAKLEAEGFFDKFWAEEPQAEEKTALPTKPAHHWMVYVFRIFLVLAGAVLLVVVLDLIRHLLS